MHRRLLVLLVTLGLVACSQVSDPIGPVRETIDQTGGTVATRDADGRRYTLTIPADAVTEATEIALTPLPPEANEYLRFELAPAGLVFAAPASFRVTLPEGTTPDADAQLYFGSLDGDFDALPTTVAPQARTLTAEIALLGTARGPVTTLQDSDPGGAAGGAAPSTLVCDAQVTLMAGALDELYASSGTLFSAAELVIDTMRDVLVACDGVEAARTFASEQRPLVENALDDALQTLDMLQVDDYDLLVGVLPPVITYCDVLELLVLELEGAPANCFPTGEIAEKFAQLDLFLENKYDTAVFETEYWRVENEIFGLLEIGEGAADLGTENATSVLGYMTGLSADLRRAAWSYCVATRVQYPLWRQTNIAELLYDPLDLDTVLEDIDSCGSTIEIDVFTPADRRLAGQSRNFDFTEAEPGGADLATAKSPVTGRIVVNGDVLPLRCNRPLGAENYGTDRLEILLNDTVLATLTRNGDRFFDEALTFDLADALAAAGIDPTDPPEEVWLEIRRMDATAPCRDDDDAPDPMTTTLFPGDGSLVAAIAYAFDPAPEITSLAASPASIPADESTTVTLSVGYRDDGANIVSPAGDGFGAASGIGTIQMTFTPPCQDDPYTLSESVQLRDAFDQTSASESTTISVNVDPACTVEPFEIVSISYDNTIVSGEAFEEEGIVVTLLEGAPPPYRIVVRPRSCPPGVTCNTVRDEEDNPPWDTGGFQCSNLEPGDDPIEFDYEILVESNWNSSDDNGYRATPPYPTPWTCLPPPS